jgi:Protein of unknown function (DUF3429)
LATRTAAATAATTPPAEAPGIPRAAALLGFAGALPFAALSLASLVPGWPSTLALHALLGYGVAILSFLGGVHWGLGIGRGEPTLARLGASVLPSLVAWLAHVLGGPLGLLVLAAAFAALLAYDLAQTRRGAAPALYPRLRWPLTAIVLACLLLAALATLAATAPPPA